MDDHDWKLLERQVLGFIQLTLSRLVAHNHSRFDGGLIWYV